MYRRTRSRLNIYAILVDGDYVANVSAENTRSAIMAYCRSNGIGMYNGCSYGECGLPTQNCCKSIYNGLRPCGRLGKCYSQYIAMTDIGNIMAVPTPTGGIGG